MSEPIPTSPLLSVRHLQVTFEHGHGGLVSPVVDVSFDLAAGERFAVVGESGSGKSLTAMSLLGLIGRMGGNLGPRTSIRFRDREVTEASEPELRQLRRTEFGMIFQDPLTSLNPIHSIGRHLLDAISLRGPDLPPDGARTKAIELLEQVKLPRAERLLDAYPHELSGGMRQRVMIALALTGDPALLIGDEPTTALDVTVQAEILDLVHELSERRRLAVLMITHDLSIVAGFAHEVLVMYGGRVVEQGPTADLFSRPSHPYTAALLRSIPPLDRNVRRLLALPGAPPDPSAKPSGCAFHPRCPHADTTRCREEIPERHPTRAGANGEVACHRADELDLTTVNSDEASWEAPQRPRTDVLLEVRDLTKTFQLRGTGTREVLTAVDSVSFDLHRGESLAIVGESGSGKSTLARCVLRLVEPSAGRVTFDGVDLSRVGARKLRHLRSEMQMIFQDPASSMDPRLTVRRILSEPLRIHGRWGSPGNDEARLLELLDLVKLPSDALARYPQEFSGGQRQRIAIARALTLRPSLLVCDEPVSALDVSVRSSVLNLLSELRDELDLTLIFIAHDLALVRFLCDRIGVMYRGDLVELRGREELFADPHHPHTAELLASQPVADPAVEVERRRARRAGRLSRPAVA